MLRVQNAVPHGSSTIASYFKRDGSSAADKDGGDGSQDDDTFDKDDDDDGECMNANVASLAKMTSGAQVISCHSGHALAQYHHRPSKLAGRLDRIGYGER